MVQKSKEEKNLSFSNNKEKNKKNERQKGKGKNKTNKKLKPENNQFSFENEIVIGVTKKDESKKETKKQKSNQTKKNKAKRKTITPNKKKETEEKKKKKKVTQKRVLSPEEQEKQAKKKRRTVKIIKYSTLLILFIIVIVCAMFSPLFNIKTIQVEGNQKITENEIISLSQIKIEQNTFQISKNKVEKQIKQNAYIEQVNIIRKLPSNIIIQVKEREPAYLLEYAGSYIYLDKQGYLLEISQEKIELPILQGAVTPTSDFITGNRLVKEDLEKLSILLKIMELAKINEIDSLITRVDIENKENILLVFETKGKTAHLGDSTNLNTKILTIKSILEREEGKAGEIFVNMDLNKEDSVFRETV